MRHALNLFGPSRETPSVIEYETKVARIIELVRSGDYNIYRPPKEPTLGVLIKTGARTDSLLNLLDSFFSKPINLSYRIYLADDGRDSAIKNQLYNKLSDNGHVVERFSYNAGASYTRNQLISRMDEPYVLRLDDDYEVLDDTRLDVMLDILNSDPQHGAISDLELQIGTGKNIFDGDVSPHQGFFRRQGGTLLKEPIQLNKVQYSYTDDYKYITCDYTRNFLLIKRQLFDDVQWDEDLSFKGEHEDFMLQLGDSSWKLVFTPDSMHGHNEKIGLTNTGYTQKRSVTDDGCEEVRVKERVFKEKWGITNIKNKRSLYDYVRGIIIKLLLLTR